MNEKPPDTATDQEIRTYNISIAPRFSHPNNIDFGLARVIYVESPPDGGQAGWALPGRSFTTDREEALSTAFHMDRASKMNSQPWTKGVN
jgi:hypothetical protein